MRFLEKHFGKLWMAAVYVFLYLPLFFMIVFSFNSTRQDANFTGFSLPCLSSTASAAAARSMLPWVTW